MSKIILFICQAFTMAGINTMLMAPKGKEMRGFGEGVKRLGILIQQGTKGIMKVLHQP